MCLASLDEQTIIRTKLEEWFARGDMFTSVDIANDIKKDGHFIRNRNVASYLRESCLDDAAEAGYVYIYKYIRVTLENGQEAGAFLYMPYMADPSDYVNTSQVALKPSDVTPQATDQSVVADEEEGTDADEVAAPDPIKKSIDTYSYLNNLRRGKNAST